MTALPDLPPRQRPAFASVVLTVAELGPEPVSRRTVLERSGLSWTSWRESVARVALAGFLVVEKGSRDGREASYSLTPEGRAAVQELKAGAEGWAPSPRRPPLTWTPAHPAPTLPRARSSLPLAFKATRNEKAAAEQATPGAHLDAHLTPEDHRRIGQEVAQELVRLLGLAAAGLVQDPAHGLDPIETEAPGGTERAQGVHTDPDRLASALNRPSHPEATHVAQVLVEEEVKTEDDALAFGRHVLDSATIHSPGAFVRLLVRGLKTISDKERAAALAAKDPPPKAPKKLSEVESLRLASLETRIASARRRGHDQAAAELEAERDRLKAG